MTAHDRPDPALRATADALIAARHSGTPVPTATLKVAGRAAAYVVHDLTIAAIGPAGGWKVGAPGPGQEPSAAPLPAAGIVTSGTRFDGPQWRKRGVEVEVAFILGADLPARATPYTRDDVAAAIRQVVPVIEEVETRLAGWPDEDADVKLADLQSHGALVTGKPLPFDPRWLDLSEVDIVLRFDDKVVAQTHGGNVHPDVGLLMAWTANHAASRGMPLAAGQIVTTGSTMGVLLAPAGTAVVAEITGLGAVSLQF